MGTCCWRKTSQFSRLYNRGTEGSGDTGTSSNNEERIQIRIYRSLWLTGFGSSNMWPAACFMTHSRSRPFGQLNDSIRYEDSSQQANRGGSTKFTANDSKRMSLSAFGASSPRVGPPNEWSLCEIQIRFLITNRCSN